MNPLTQQGINALKLGDRTAARQLLAAAIKQDPRDVTAWLWLAGALDKEEEQIDCLRYVLKVDPQNQAATRGLSQLLERRSAQAAPKIVTEPAPAAQPTQPEPAPETPPAAARPVEPEPAPLSPPAATAPILVEESAPEAAQEAAPDVTPDAQQSIEAIRESFQAFDEPLATSDLLLSEPTREELLDALADEEEIDLPAPAEAAVWAAASETAMADTREGSVQAAEAEPTLLANITGAARRPFRRRAAQTAEAESARLIFRARPSLVPALASFWLFLFGTLGVAALLRDEETPGLLLAVGVGILLEFVVLYAVVRGLAERYELTSQALTVRFRGKRARIPIADIYNAVCTQSFFQRLLSTGNIEIDASVGGQLSHLRLRNIPQCRQRTDQIMYLVNDHDAT